MELSWDGLRNRADTIAERILDRHYSVGGDNNFTAYPVPRGGVYAALAIQDALSRHRRRCANLKIVPSLSEAMMVIDDIVDSGKTRASFPLDKPFYALIDKKESKIDDWVSFPWERWLEESGPQDNIRRIIQFIGDDPDREGLLETPDRVVRSYAELFSGYQYKTDKDVGALLKVFEDGACDEMVLLKGIPFNSFCEHHMMGFNGKAHIAYIPDGRVVGLSKMARILDVYAKRLQVQERLTQQVTAALDLHLKPKGSACVIEAAHQCMSCRGVNRQGSTMVTSSLTGDFRKPEVRAEFFSLIKG